MSITFKRLNKDSGVLQDELSIQPLNDGELISQSIFRRPADNLRVRTEELARAVESLEYIFQSVNNSSLLLRYVNNGSTYPGLLTVYSKTFAGVESYYVVPKLPTGVGTLPSVIVMGSATNSFNYILNKATLEAFYSQGEPADLVDSHNRTLGISSTGDSLCLRIPTVPASYTSESLLPVTTSNLLSAGESPIDSDLAVALTTQATSAADATFSIIKIPSKNSIKITPTPGGDLAEFLENQVSLVGSSNAPAIFEVQGTDGGDVATLTPKYTLDVRGIRVVSAGVYQVPRAGYRDLEDLVDSTIDTFSYFLESVNNPTAGAGSTVVEATTMLPKNEYFYPLAVHTGDSILLPGLGGVNIVDIVTRGGSVDLDSSGILVGETGTAVQIFSTRTNISYAALSAINDLRNLLITADTGHEYFRLPIDVYVPEAGVSQELYLHSAEVQLVLDETYATSATLTEHAPRDVYITLGVFDLTDPILTNTLTSSKSIKYSLWTCSPGVTPSEFEEEAYPHLFLSNFGLRSLKDDYVAQIEIPDSIRNVNAYGKTVLVWIYRVDDPDDFFVATDKGSINLDLRLTWATRLGDTVNLASSAALLALS